MSIINNTTKLQELKTIIESLPEAGGVELPELTNEATAADMLSGKQLIDDEGNVITGTFTIDNELNTQDALITQLSEILDTKAAASGVELPTLTNPASASEILTGYEAIDGDGNVIEGSIATKVATTYTPTTTNQTIAAGTYCSGTQTIAGDANLVAENIKSGVSIFGVTGSAESGSGSASTATVELTNTNPLPAHPVYYIGIDGAISAEHDDAPFTCIAPSIMALNDGGRIVSTSGSISLLLKNGNVSAYLINGNGTIMLTSASSGSDN